MATYDTLGHYVIASKSIQEKITNLDSIIDMLLDTSILAAGSAHLDEYNLDDGQTKIKTIYRSASQVAGAIDAFEKIRTRCINKLNGRTFVLRDAKSLKFYNGTY